MPHPLRFWAAAPALAALAALLLPPASATNVLTYHNNVTRYGANTEETVLTPANVNAGAFGKIFTLPTDGQVYAQPLVMTGVPIANKGTHDVVFVATMHDSLYAFDANDGTPLWQTSFVNPPNVTSVPYGDLGNGYGDIILEVGVIGTPVIDDATNTLYVVSKAKDVTGGVTTYVQKLHAIDITSGAERPGSPVTITASFAGTASDAVGGKVPFNGRNENQRGGLLLNNGVVYIPWASHEDKGPYHGWLIGYKAWQTGDTAALKQTSVFCSTPNGTWSGFWQGGGGPAADASGDIYAVTGNGDVNFAPDTPGLNPPDTNQHANNNFGNTMLRLHPNGTRFNVVTSFTPYNWQDLNGRDADLGSSGAMPLPDQPATNDHPRLMVGFGKDGVLYLVDRDKMGGYHSGSNAVVQQVTAVNGGVWGMPAYWNGRVFYGGAGDSVRAYGFDGTALSNGPLNLTSHTFGYPGATPAISSNGTANGILWALDISGYSARNPAVLHAYNALDLTQELYNSAMVGSRDGLGPAIKFSVPTIANGKVYVGHGSGVSVFGAVPLSVISASASQSITQVDVAFSRSLDAATAQDPANYAVDGGVTVSAAALDANGTTVHLTTSPLTPNVSYTLTVNNVQDAGSPPTAVPADSHATFAYVNLSGDGLLGAYYIGKNFDTFTTRRVDPTVNFDFQATPPPGNNGSTDNFSVRWTGYVEPATTETYTFTTQSDDGVRLFVNGVSLVDNWTDHGTTDNSGTIALVAGRRYTVRMDYYEGLGGAIARLYFSSPSIGKTIIPQSQLYSQNPFTYNNAVAATRIAAGLVIPAPGDVTLLDVEHTGDSLGRVDMADAARLARKSAGLDANP